MKKFIRALAVLLVIPLYPQVPRGIVSTQKVKNSPKIVRCEIEDLLPDHPIIQMQGEWIFDTWTLLPKTTLLLPLPTKFNVIEQIKRVVAWEYKMAPDRDLYKEEYLALINDPRKWVQFISDNLSIVQNGSKLAWHAAAQAANSQDYDTAKKMYEDSVGLLGNYMTWITSIDPIWVTKTLKENAAKKMHTDRAM